MKCFTTLIAMLMAGVASAQQGQEALLTGTVRDASGAVIRQAAVTVNGRTLIGGPRRAETDAAGVYRVPFLPAGSYDVTTEVPGFAAESRRHIDVLPGMTSTVDFVMGPASVQEAAAAAAEAPLLDVRASSSPAIIGGQLLDNLPLSRTLSSAINLAPGVVQDVAFGGTAFANGMTLDGTKGTEPGYGQPFIYPSIEWIQEIQIVSVGADARYGEFTGAIQNSISRSGTNAFRGLVSGWTTQTSWASNNRGSLAPNLQSRFSPLAIVSRWDANLQGGGPLRRDRFWFFAGVETYRNANLPANFNAANGGDQSVKDGRERKGMLKLTGALNSRVRAEGFIERGLERDRNTNAGALVTSDALSVYHFDESIWNARVLWTVNSRAYVEVVHGGTHQEQYSGPAPERRSGPAAHFDLLTSFTTGNTSLVSDYASTPVTIAAHLTYYPEWRRGSRHQFRAGVEYEHDRLLSTSGYVGGRLYTDSGGEPNQLDVWGGATYRPLHTRRTIYVQDAWTIADHLTINGGARIGFYGGSVPAHDGAFSDHSVSPRIGVAYDVAGDHRTAVRGHYGWYHDEMVTSFYDFLDPLSQTDHIVYTYDGSSFVESFRRPKASEATIDPNLRYPFVEEWLGGLEHQWRWGVSTTAQYIRRDFKNSIGFMDPGRVWIPVAGVDPGPDGRRGTADDGGEVTVYYDLDSSRTTPVLTNPSAYRRYQGLQFIARKRQASNVEFQASYTWSRTVGNYNNAAYANAANNDLGTNGVFVNPNRLINAEGRTPQDFPHEVKVLGTWGFKRWSGGRVSGVYRYQSGRTWARSAGGFGAATETNVIFMEPRATRRMGSVNTLDLRVQQDIRIGPMVPGFFLDVFNLWNQGVALRTNNMSGSNLGVPNAWSEPRTARAGVRMVF